MKSYLVPAVLTAFLVGPTAAFASAAEDFGEILAVGQTVSGETAQLAAQKLSGDDLDDRIVMSDDIISTQSVGITAGHARLAAEMGVDPNDYTNAELAKMYIGEYD